MSMMSQGIASEEAREIISKNNSRLWHAASRGNMEAVMTLLSEPLYAPDVNSTHEKDGKTALMYAAMKGHLSVVEYLAAAGADLDARTTDGRTALMAASFLGHLGVVQCLIALNADVNAANTQGATALMHACQEGHLDIVKYLIAKGADVNAGTREGKTPLMFACQEGHTAVAMHLLSSGARIDDARRVDGKTALMFAVDQGHVDCVKSMMARGANPMLQLQNGRTVMDMAKTLPMRQALQSGRRGV